MTFLGAELSPLRWLPERASSVAGEVDGIYLGLLLVSGGLVALLIGLNLTFLVRYRRGSSAPRPPLKFPAWKIEFVWIALTVVIFLGLFAWSAPVYVRAMRAPAGAYELHVTGRQWMWDVRHPNGRREFNSLRVPAGRPIRLILDSEDVIHSFYVPAFRLKQDVVPGKQVSLWFEAIEPGTYHLFCAEFCGSAHAAMTGSVIVLSPAGYAEWLDAGAAPTDAIDRGRRLFTLHGCSGCHAEASRIHAPPLEGLYGREIPLDSGGFVRADDRYLRDSILLPDQEIAAGYEPIMPSYQGQIAEADLLDLVAYLKSLRGETPSTPPVSPVLLPGP